jgi:acyl phosphate:glycerol-3-phosphate acyltransferase
MTSTLAIASCSLAAYLLGAMPFGYVISRARGIDIRQRGSGNIGATNVFRSVGKTWGVLTFICDFLKGFVAAFFFPLAAVHLAPSASPEILRVLCAFMAVAGHNWPVFLGFRGGKGVATSAGALLGIAWQAVLVGVGVWVVLFLLTRYVSVASIVSAFAIAGAAWPLYAKHGRLIPIALTLLGVIIVWRHKGNIQLLLNGAENRFEFKKKPTETGRKPE